MYDRQICMSNLLTVTEIYCHLPAIHFIAHLLYGQALTESLQIRSSFITDSYLEKNLLETGYSEKMVRKEILQARATTKEVLLEKVHSHGKAEEINL